MGTITISFNGSFGWKQPRQFSAMSAGHAAAIAEAIKYLAGEEMQKAILNDHECQRDNIEPAKGFGGIKKILPEPPK